MKPQEVMPYSENEFVYDMSNEWHICLILYAVISFVAIYVSHIR